MPKKKKYILAEGYILVIAMGLLQIFLLLLAPYARRPATSKGFAVVVMTYMLFTFGRHYVFSETGIKVYILGIRIRNVLWSDVGRLILFHNETARQKKNYGVYLVVEKRNCDPPFPDEGNAKEVHSFFFMNPDAFKIDISHKDPQISIDAIEQFRKIDDIYYWLRDE